MFSMSSAFRNASGFRGDWVPAPSLRGTHSDRKSTRPNSSHVSISYAVFCLKKKRRQKSCTSYQALTSPRVLRSDGEKIAGVYRRDPLPAGQLACLPACAGTGEGRDRGILAM